MRLMQRLAGLLVFFALSATLISSLDPALGQTPGSPVEQILQGLSPEQLGAISQQLGGVGGTGGTQGAQGLTRQLPQTEEQQSLLLQQQRDALMDQQRQRAEVQRLSPFLQAEDWVVITIDFNPLPAGNAPAPTALPPSALGALAGAPGQQQQNILGNLAPAITANQAQPGSGTQGA